MNTDYLKPFGCVEFEKGIMFLYNFLPENVSLNKPSLEEIEGEMFALFNHNICVPVEKIPLDRFLKDDINKIILAVINESYFVAKIAYVIEMRKETMIDLLSLVKAKKLLFSSVNA